MKILTLDHIGIAVEKIDASLPVWEGILGLPLHGIEEVAEQKVKTAFIPMGESEIELLETTDPEGPIGKFLVAKGQGVHHLAFRVANIDEALAELKAKGVRLIDETPRYGAGGARIAFIHPKATGGVLVELCERA
ncbi:MAG: methylmalonyl-CoA epimerase [Spirochaetaceae bacterium]|nr:methylmalonyl-CoA epimerase [Spirochaetaceae bacterium]